jgi:hypothetical protein
MCVRRSVERREPSNPSGTQTVSQVSDAMIMVFYVVRTAWTNHQVLLQLLLTSAF